MRLKAYFRLLTLNLHRNWRQFSLSGLGIAVGIGTLFFFASLGIGTKRWVMGEFFGNLEVNQVEVVPKTYNLGLFKGKNPLARKFDDALLDEFRKLPGVKAVYGKMNLKAPVHAVIPVPKELRKYGVTSSFYTELVVQGIDPRAVREEELTAGKFEYRKGKGPIPVLVSRRLLDLYNATLAEMRGFPRLTAEAAKLVPVFDLVVGRSLFQTRVHPKGVRRLKAKIVGVSSRAILVGLTVPLQYVKELNKIYSPADSGIFQSAIIETRRPEDIPAVLKKVEEMGFEMDSGQVWARKIGEIISIITVILMLVSGLILFGAAVSIGHAFYMTIYERRVQLGLMRAIGATRGQIRSLILGEALSVGLLSGLLGVLLSWGVIRALLFFLPKYTELPFALDKLFFVPLWLPFVAVGFALLFCTVGAFIPAQKAASLDPAEVLHSA